MMRSLKNPLSPCLQARRKGKKTTKMNKKCVTINSEYLVKICQLFLGRDKEI
jgi:hypothetical protein